MEGPGFIAWLPFLVTWTLIGGVAWMVWRVLRRLNEGGREVPPSSSRKPE